MGFIARTIFWLGLVYSAMPFDFGSQVADHAAMVAAANPLAPCAQGPTEDCRRRVGDLRKALDAVAALQGVDRIAAATEQSEPQRPKKAERTPPD